MSLHLGMIILLLSLTFFSLLNVHYFQEDGQTFREASETSTWAAQHIPWSDKKMERTPTIDYAFQPFTPTSWKNFTSLNAQYFVNGQEIKYTREFDGISVNSDWEYMPVNFEPQVRVDKKSFQKHGDEYPSFTEDRSHYYFPYLDWSDWNAPVQTGVKKSELPHLQFIADIGEQALSAVALYSDGYLVLPPYKFPVDHQTFSFIPRDERGYPLTWSAETENKRTQWRVFYQNWWRQYTRYLGNDKNWVYRWGEYTLIREKKKADFRLLSFPEIKTYVSSGQPRDIKAYTGTIDEKNRKLIGKDFSDEPNLYYHDNKMYFLYYYWNAVFPIDWASMKYEVVPYTTEEWYKSYYTLLSDKDYYYQLIWHYDGDYYTLNRIKK